MLSAFILKGIAYFLGWICLTKSIISQIRKIVKDLQMKICAKGQFFESFIKNGGKQRREFDFFGKLVYTISYETLSIP